MSKLDKETKEKVDRIKATLNTLDEWDRYSDIYFYGKASSKEEVRETVIKDLFTNKEVGVLIEYFSDALVFDEEKVKAIFYDELEENEDVTWEELLDGDDLNSFVFSCLDTSIDRNELIDLLDTQATKENVAKYIKVIKIYDFYFFSFSYYPKDEYDEFDDSNIEDLFARYGSGFVQFISSVHVDKEIDDKVGDSFEISDEIDLDNRDNPFIYIDGKVYEADDDMTHAQLINKIFNGDIYYELDRLRDDSDFSELRELTGKENLPIAVGHVVGDKAFIEESSLFNCSVDEVVNALKKKFHKVYNYSYPYKITRLAKLSKLSKLDKETKEKVDRIKTTLETLDKWDEYSDICFYGKASSKEEVRETVIKNIFENKEVNTLLDYFEDALVFDEEKVKAYFKDELEESEDVTWEELLDGDDLDSFVFNCLDVSIDRNDLIDLLDIQTTKENIAKYIKVIKIYDFYFFSFSYYPRGEYDEFDDSNIEDLFERYKPGFIQFISSVHVDKDIDDKVGDSFDISGFIDLDNRDNPFIYIDGEVYEADDDMTHAQLINKIFNGDIYFEFSRLRNNRDFSKLRNLKDNKELPIAIGHVVGDKAFIEESSLFNCTVDEVVNALKKKFTKVYNYSFPYKITRLAKLVKHK